MKRQTRRNNDGCIVQGNISSIRAIEITISKTKKYSKGIRLKRKPEHPIQGGEFPSKAFSEYYEVYPEIEELSWDMPAGVALDLLWQDTPCLDVTFWYDYRHEKATMTVRGGIDNIKRLEKAIPGFAKAVNEAKAQCSRVEVMANGK